jgi:hypothetical protein
MKSSHVRTAEITAARYPRFWFRFWEILPGLCVWVAIITPFILAGRYPLTVTVFILLFDVYWLMTAFTYGYILLKGYRLLRRNMRTNWMAKLEHLDKLSPQERQAQGIMEWQDIYHAVIMPTYKEDQGILEASIESVTASNYPHDRLIFVLATEERAGAPAQEIAAVLRKKYAGEFAHFLVTCHPDDIVGEVKAKGANATWGCRELVKLVEKENIPLDRVIVSTADADSRFPRAYFPRLSYLYATTPDRTRCAFQPIAMFFNNIWKAPVLSRVMAFGTTFWQMIESVREYRLITFATHAMSLRTLVEINYWDTSIVNEDSRQFFRAYFHYNGRFRNVPLFLPIYMDAVHVGNLWGSLRNLYIQQQRWAYGVEHFPYIVLESWRQRKRIPTINLISLVWRAWQGSFTWATTAFFITVVGWLPLVLNDNFRDQVVASNFPVVTKTILSLTWIGLFISSWITLRLLDGTHSRHRFLDTVRMIAQWVLVPIVSIFFGALPGIDAQTRLMLGRYLGFRVTEKVKAS